MKKKISAILTVAVLVLIIPLSCIITGFALPPQYGATYYAELPDMVNRLKTAEGKRIIVVGNSGVAFALRGDLVERELSGYTVCPFGLYGAIGTKTMMDLSKPHIREGDIVILAPEQLSQSLSLYFSGEHVLPSVESDWGLLTNLDYKNSSSIVGNFSAYLGNKFGYWKSGSAPDPKGVYRHDSFDSNCNMVFERPHNVMPDGVDTNSLISYDKSVFSEDFADYVKEYGELITKRGATLLFGFVPVNASAISPDTTAEDIDEYYDYVSEVTGLELLGSPHNYILEKEWFYDNNVHCNSSGAVVYTRNLVKHLKAYLKDSSKTQIEIPEKPQLPDGETVDGNDAEADCFEYSETDGRLTITGLTQKGGERTELTIPTSFNGKRVTAFSASAFSGNTVIERIILQKNIRSIADSSFNGCTSLKRLYVAKGENPSVCAVYGGLFDGAPNCKIYIESSLLSAYATDYFWARYANLMVAY